MRLRTPRLQGHWPSEPHGGVTAEPGWGPGLVRRVCARVPAQHGRHVEALAAYVPGMCGLRAIMNQVAYEGPPGPAPLGDDEHSTAHGAGDAVAAPGVVLKDCPGPCSPRWPSSRAI